MPLHEARRLCPGAHYVEGSPEKYVALSLQLLELYTSYTPDVEPFSVDEAFVGLGPRVPMDEAVKIAREIQATIERRFGLGASIGLGPNKLIAKMAAGLEKPRGLTPLDEPAFRAAFWPRDIQEMWGVGPRLAMRMRSLGFKTVGDLAHAPEPLLRSAFGIIGPQLREAAWGRDDTPIVPYHRGVDAKSMGHEVTLPEDCDDPAFLEGTLLRLADQVARRLRTEGYVGRTVTLKLRNRRFETITRQRALAAHTADRSAIFGVARALWLEHWKGDAVRLIGLSLAALDRPASGEQVELFAHESRSKQLERALDRVRDKLGEASVVPAGSLTHRRGLAHVPFGILSNRAPERRTPRPS
jgi:DNA polymerase-4